jgi:DNA-binding NarL/FixJ family response regulator
MSAIAGRPGPVLANSARERAAVVCEDRALAARLALVLRDAGLAVGDAAAGADVVVTTAEFRPLERPEALAALCAEAGAAPVVVVGAGVNAVRKALHAGATGFVEERDLERALAPTVHAALAGQVALPRERREEQEAPALSAREKAVLTAVARGLTNAEIGASLFLAESTVKSHLSSGFRKLGVRSRAEAAAVIASPGIREALGLPGAPAPTAP